MDPLTRSLTLTRGLKPPGSLEARQGNPLTVIGTLAETDDDLTGFDNVVCEIRSARTDSSATAPLVSQAIALTEDNAAGPWTFEFSTAEMNLPLAAGKACRELWLEITAVTDDPERLETLTARGLTLIRSTYSGLTAEPPPPALYYTKAQVDEIVAAFAAASTRIADATLSAGEETIVLTIAAGEAVLSPAAQAACNLTCLYTTYSDGGTTATLQFSATADADIAFKIPIQLAAP